MKKFIKNIFIFAFVVILTFILFVASTFFVYKQKLNSVQFDKNISIIICGDSHTMSGINDSLVKNSINISNSSQHYLYTFNLLKLVFKNNPQIKTVILGSSFHSFSEDDLIIFKGDIAASFYPTFFPILDYESAKLITSNNFSGVVKSSNNINKTIMEASIKNYNSYQRYPFIGRYYSSDNNNLNDSTVAAAIKRHFYQPNGNEQEFSNYQNKYLNKIVILCRTNNVKLIIVNTPIHDNYYQKIPKKFISNYYSTLSSLNGIIFWDFHSLRLENRCFGDGDHLNARGAKEFSLKIDSVLQNR